MTIILLNPQNKKLYICIEGQQMQIVDPNDPDVLKYIPNDDILYVENGHIVQKEQFAKWLNEGISEFPQKVLSQDFDTGFRFEATRGQSNIPVAHQRPSDPNKLFIHPVHNGTILIQDIQTDRFPEGIELNGKYHFLAIDEIGQENLEESNHFRVLLAKGKIEIVNEAFVRKHQHKHKQRSAADAALDAILIKDDRPGAGRRAAEMGIMNTGMHSSSHGYSDAAIPIYVE